MPRVPCVISSRSPSSTALLGPLDDRLRRQQALDFGGDLLVSGRLAASSRSTMIEMIGCSEARRYALATIDGLHLVDRAVAVASRSRSAVMITDLVGREASVSGRHGTSPTPSTCRRPHAGRHAAPSSPTDQGHRLGRVWGRRKEAEDGQFDAGQLAAGKTAGFLRHPTWPRTRT